MQTLPYDYARCAGTTREACQVCRRRREPGDDFAQWYMTPPINMLTGQCAEFIEPPRVTVAANTTPNV